MSSRSIVVAAVDASPKTEYIVEFAVSVARARAADLHVIQVGRQGGPSGTASESETRLRARLRALRPLADREAVPLRLVTLRGSPERAIPAYAQLAGASLVVVGRNYATSRLWRSAAVTSRLSRQSPVPVLVIPESAQRPARVSPTHVLAAVDFTVASAMALRAAVDVSRRHDARLTVLHVADAPPMVFGGGEAVHLRRQLPAQRQRLAERLTRQARALGFRDVDPVVATGFVDRAIVDTATETAADLIVMGVPRRTWMAEVVSGSTLRGVLRRAQAPVLVLPVTAGDYEWIEDFERDREFGRPLTTDTTAPLAA